MTPPELLTSRLRLRGHQMNDFAQSAALWADPEVVRFISGTPMGEEQSWARFLRYAGHWAHLGFGYWVAECRDSGAFIGEVGFADYRRAVHPTLAERPEAGWVLARAYHGKGYASEALAGMLGWADAHLEAAKTCCIFDPAHHASIRVAEKQGYGSPVMGHYEGKGETLILERARRQS